MSTDTPTAPPAAAHLILSGDIARLDLRLRRRSVIGYGLGMAVYVLIVVVIYPTFRNETGLNQLTANGSKLAALFGATGSLTSPQGWLNANIYANFLPLVVLLLAIGYGASCLAGQNEDGTLALVATLPASRWNILAQKAATLAVQAIPVPLVTALLVLAGRGFDLTTPTGALLGATAGALLLGIDLGLLAMLVGALTGSRGTALGTASAFAAASYLISALAPVTHWIRPLRYGSLFYWAAGNDQLNTGLDAASLTVLIATAAVLTLATGYAFARLDIR